jgi:hypothetical protein
VGEALRALTPSVTILARNEASGTSGPLLVVGRARCAGERHGGVWNFVQRRRIRRHERLGERKLGCDLQQRRFDGFPTVHDAAGGTGTYADPITFATDKDEFPVGTVLYVPVIDKYLVMEDDCAECDTDWSGSMKWHIDVWMNSDAAANANAVLACEDQWTQTSTVVEVNPPPGRTITTPPLFDTSTNMSRTTL